eukprot:scaffold3886_cov399-Prasinococcus_capsulatus_cf.AAC.43
MPAHQLAAGAPCPVRPTKRTRPGWLLLTHCTADLDSCCLVTLFHQATMGYKWNGLSFPFIGGFLLAAFIAAEATEEPKPVTDKYVWMVALGGILAVFAAFGIGANDVANAFATSVGSGSISIKGAIAIASVFEFTGALLMGGHVVKTIRKVRSPPSSPARVPPQPHLFDGILAFDEPGVLMYGCLCVIAAVGLWLLLATYLEMPVSTTHSAIGGMVGMTLAAKGKDCVVWSSKKDDFPYVGGVAAIVVSWILSPFFSGIIACFFFLVLRTLVLRRQNSFQYGWYVYPSVIFATVTINCFFIIYKGAKYLNLKNTPLGTALGVSFGAGAGCALISLFTFVPYIRAKTEKYFAELEQQQKDPIEVVAKDAKVDQAEVAEPTNFVSRSFKAVSDYLSESLNYKQEDILANDPTVAAIHAHSEDFDPKTEYGLRSMQVVTACCDAFAHGANDVANSVGPFAALYVIYRDNQVSKKAEMGDDAYWILSLGAVGIVLGLALYGYKILHAIGTKLVKLSPSRGICIELGAALVIIIGSRQGWPLSTTHCQVGATFGVGILEGGKGLNWWILGKTVLGWVITLIVVGFTAAAFFSQGAYAPEVNNPYYETEA